MSNYKPIILLSNLDKTIEKLMHNRIIQFHENKEIISTAHTIITLIENVQSALDNNKFAWLLLKNLEKAFDLVDHNIILIKLNYYGIRGIANVCFKSYLSNE